MDIDSYDKDPGNPKAALSTAESMAQSGKHDAAIAFAEIGLTLDPDAEMKVKLLERISISGFYSKLDRRKLLGKSACETIAIDRGNSWQTKNLARQNSTYYARGSRDLMPSTRFQEVAFSPPYDYKPMNPSITSHDGQLWMNQRTVNYLIRPDGSYDMRGDSAIRTINYIMRLGDDLSVQSAEEILPPENLPKPLYEPVIGWEDCRLFFWRGEPWCTATVRELNADGYCEIVLSRIVDAGNGKRRFADHRVITPRFTERQHEKNWMPMVVGDDLFFLYSSDPTRVIDHEGNLVSSKVAHIASDSFRGGGPLVEFEGGWLALIHESHGMPDWRRRYMHRWAWYDSIGRLARYSEAFYIKDLGIEFAAGLARHPKTGEIIASFGVHDRSSWLAVFDPSEIKRILRPAGVPLQQLPIDPDGMAWISSQTNRTLADTAVVDRSTSFLQRAALPTHGDKEKNWDNLIAIWHTILTTDSNHAVMDIGATPESAYLPSLRRLGYQDLVSINLNEPNPRTVDGIVYRQGDCTASDFPDGHFSFISCLSVIEHGVDIRKFMQESSRLLRSGGHLFVSTDYWQDPVDTMGQMAFGAPVKVFAAGDIVEMVRIAQESGLQVTGNIDLSCKQRVVNWIGMDYTFINVLFRKP